MLQIELTKLGKILIAISTYSVCQTLEQLLPLHALHQVLQET